MAMGSRKWSGWGLLGVFLCLWGPAGRAFAQGEREPNGSCAQAQTLYAGQQPLSGITSPTDVDVYRYVGTPGELAVIEIRFFGSHPIFGGGLEFAVYESPCVQPLFSGSTQEQERIEAIVPGDGQLLVAIRGQGTSFGSEQYDLRVTALPVGTIRGRLIDSASGQPIAGDRKPFGSVELHHCTPQCRRVRTATPNSRGEFEFSNRDSDLTSGEYQLVASADEHESFTSERFSVKGGEDVDAGDLVLAPPPIAFEVARPCRVLPQGGVCNYAVRILNNTEEPLEGLAWSLVTGAFPNVGAVGFEATSATVSDQVVERPLVSVPPLSSQEVSFRFALPSFAPNGTNLCIVQYLGLNPSPLGNPARGEGNLFCVTKGARGFRLLDERESHRAFQELRGER